MAGAAHVMAPQAAAQAVPASEAVPLVAVLRFVPEAAAAAGQASLQRDPHGQQWLFLEHLFAAAPGPHQQQAPQLRVAELVAPEHLVAQQLLYWWLMEGQSLLEKANPPSPAERAVAAEGQALPKVWKMQPKASLPLPAWDVLPKQVPPLPLGQWGNHTWWRAMLGESHLVVLVVMQVSVLLASKAACSAGEFVEKGLMAGSLQQAIMLVAAMLYGKPSVLQQDCQQAL